MTNEQKSKIFKLRQEGKSYSEISLLTGVSKGSIKSLISRTTNSKLLTCKNCGKEIIQKEGRKQKVFCSDECRQIWWNSHLDEVNKKAIYETTCSHCGKVFVVYGRAAQKYCSHQCYIAERYGKELESNG